MDIVEVSSMANVVGCSLAIQLALDRREGSPQGHFLGSFVLVAVAAAATAWAESTGDGGGCCGAGGAAAVSAGSSPDGITTKDLEIGAVCKALEADAANPAAASHCHGEEEAALLQKLTCGDAPIVKNSGPLEGRFVLRVVDDPV